MDPMEGKNIKNKTSKQKEKYEIKFICCVNL